MKCIFHRSVENNHHGYFLNSIQRVKGMNRYYFSLQNKYQEFKTTYIYFLTFRNVCLLTSNFIAKYRECSDLYVNGCTYISPKWSVSMSDKSYSCISDEMEEECSLPRSVHKGMCLWGL